MKRKLFSLTFIAVLLSSFTALTGCHGAKATKSFEVPETFDTSREYNITFWAKNDSNLLQKNIYIDTIKNFEEIYPNIHVTMVSYTDYKVIYSDVITNISTNTTPNVCISYPDHVATYLSGSNVVVPLEELITDENYGLGGSKVAYTSVKLEDVYEKFLDEGLIDGSYYTLPFMRSSEACYVNKDYVESLGFTLPEVLTWDFIWEVSEKAMEQKTSKQTLIPMIYKSTDNMMIQMCKQKGIDYSDENGNIYLFDNEETDELVQYIRDKGKNKLFDTFKRVSYPGNFFNKGQCIFAIDSTAGATWMGSECPNLDIPEKDVVDFETVVYPVPQFDENNVQMISQGPSICLFNKEDNQEVLASWLFAQYLLTDEVQTAYSETEGYIPVTSSATNSAAYQEYLSKAGEDNDTYYKVKIDAAKLVTENIDNTFITPVFNGSANLRLAAGDIIEYTFKSDYRDEEGNVLTEKIYSDLISLYKLNEIETKNQLLDDDGNPVVDEYGNYVYTSSNTKKLTLGALPTTSKILIVSFIAIWIFIGAYYAYTLVKRKKRS